MEPDNDGVSMVKRGLSAKPVSVPSVGRRPEHHLPHRLAARYWLAAQRFVGGGNGGLFLLALFERSLLCSAFSGKSRLGNEKLPAQQDTHARKMAIRKLLCSFALLLPGLFTVNGFEGRTQIFCSADQLRCGV